jgi:predicted enzyme related to lactoylglutathione lyase
MARFFDYHLRTTDVAAARAFYASVLGTGHAEIFPLHEHALARGARPHWLGYIDVGDVDAATSAFVARGATQLGRWVNPKGLEVVVVRDPGGAIVAVAKPAPRQGNANVFPDVVWHQLGTVDVERAKTNYRELIGWEFKEPIDLDSLGVVHPFAWQSGGEAVGAMSDIAQRPGMHTHWLFHFRVAALGPALENVRAGGGSVVGPFVLPSGDRVAACDDPQGAAFGLFEFGAASTLRR